MRDSTTPIFSSDAETQGAIDAAHTPDGGGSRTATEILTRPASPSTPSTTSAPLTAQKPAHLPGLDGIRAIAVLAVMLYHFEWADLPGGFLGVDIFFVLSGYLITSQLWARWSTGQIRLGAFWAARIRRLLPAVLLLLPVTSIAMLVASRDQLRSFVGDVVAAATYTSNWWYVVHERSYFEATGRPPILQHLWSLAVEEQFYLVWPLVVAAIFIVLKRDRVRQVTLYAVALGLASGSALAMYLGTAAAHVPEAGDPSRFYFGTDTHASGLLLGAALAIARRGRGFQPGGPTLGRAGVLRTGIGIVALAALLVAMTQVDEFSTPLYRWGFGALALLTVIVVWASTPSGPLAELLGTQPMRYLGQRSYGLYLWHWPVAAFTRPEIDLPWAGWRVLVLRLALTLILAELSYRLVEQPVRTRGWRDAWRGLRARHLSVPTTIGVGLVTTGLVVGAVSPPRPANEAAFMALRPPTTQQTGPTQIHPSDVTPDAGAGVERGDDMTRATSPTAQPTAKAQPPTTASATRAPAGQLSGTRRLSLIVYGDSVALGAEPGLRTAFATVDNRASVGEQSWDLLPRVARSGSGGADVVLLHTGNNGVVSADQLSQALNALSGVRRVVVVIPRVPRSWQDPNLRSIPRGAKGHANVRIVDWYSMSAGHPEYFADGLHLSERGLRVYTAAVQKAALAD